MSNRRAWLAGVAKSMGVRRHDPPPVRGFDWYGVRVNHWIVLEMTHQGKGGSQVWSCLSACGVRSPFRAADLAAGATKTCEACRAGATAPPTGRVLPDAAIDGARSFFLTGDLLVEIKSNLKGPEAVAEWDDTGLDLLHAAVDRTGLGREYGWKACVRDAHRRTNGKAGVRVRSWRDGVRGVELSVATGGYLFEVDLSTGRTDRPWAEVKAALDRAVNPPASAAGQTGIAGSEDRLVKLRNGLDRAIEVSKDARAGAELRAEIARRIADAAKRAAPLKAALDKAAAEAADLEARAKAAKELADSRAAALKQAVDARDQLTAGLAGAVAAQAAAEEKCRPAAEELAAAEAELEEAEREEAERTKTMEKAGDVAVLLAALEKLGLS